MKQMTQKEEYLRMKAALRNILELSKDEFAKSQARYGLNIKVEVSEGEK
ncbi:hypothetical protein [Paenibacillus glucanolyticus]|nr:hypothetical protein [Paenibacillus glucanolyticus]